jgi:hypothetical protein
MALVHGRMNMPSDASLPAPARRVPGEFLLRPEPAGAALVIAFNDFWLKSHHPGVLSGKLSDLGLCFLGPLVVAAVFEWVLRLVTWRKPFAPLRTVYVASTLLTAAYFVLIKTLPAGARLHVEALSALFSSHHFAAVADPTDLVCLPLVAVAFRFLDRRASRI